MISVVKDKFHAMNNGIQIDMILLYYIFDTVPQVCLHYSKLKIFRIYDPVYQNHGSPKCIL